MSVIPESGFWLRAERLAFRTGEGELGADSKLFFLDVPRDEVVARLIRRNTELPPGAFHVDVSDVDRCIDLFESPTPDELA